MLQKESSTEMSAVWSDKIMAKDTYIGARSIHNGIDVRNDLHGGIRFFNFFQ